MEIDGLLSGHRDVPCYCLVGPRRGPAPFSLFFRHQVFPKCNHRHMEEVMDNIMEVFDTKDTGFVDVRELLTTFSLCMESPIQQRLRWAFR